MIRPTVGRIVLFCPPLGLEDLAPDGGRCAAMITAVKNDHKINLVWWSQSGTASTERDVVLYQPEDDTPGPDQRRFAEWMPYQKGQAAKTEEGFEKALGEQSATLIGMIDSLRRELHTAIGFQKDLNTESETESPSSQEAAADMENEGGKPPEQPLM